MAAGSGEIGRAVARLRTDIAPPTLTLTSTTAFLSHWFVPRMEAFRLELPALDLRLQVSTTIEALQSGGIDVAIRFGPGPFPATVSTPLCNDRILPVCHPGLAVSTHDDLHGATLIHIDDGAVPAPSPTGRSGARWRTCGVWTPRPGRASPISRRRRLSFRLGARTRGPAPCGCIARLVPQSPAMIARETLPGRQRCRQPGQKAIADARNPGWRTTLSPLEDQAALRSACATV